MEFLIAAETPRSKALFPGRTLGFFCVDTVECREA